MKINYYILLVVGSTFLAYCISSQQFWSVLLISSNAGLQRCFSLCVLWFHGIAYFSKLILTNWWPDWKKSGIIKNNARIVIFTKMSVKIKCARWNQGWLFPICQMGSTNVTLHDLRATEKKTKLRWFQEAFLWKSKHDGTSALECEWIATWELSWANLGEIDLQFCE